MTVVDRIVALATRQLDAYNAADLDGFCSCYHADVRVFSGGELRAEGAETFRGLYEAKFAQGGFGGTVPRRVERGDVCVEEEHYWVDGPNGRIEGALLVEYTLKDDRIGTVRFFRFDGLVGRVRAGLLDGDAVVEPGLGRFSPCHSKKKDCWTVMFRASEGAGCVEVEAIRAFLAAQDQVELMGLGTLLADDHKGQRRLRFRASNEFLADLTAAL